MIYADMLSEYSAILPLSVAASKQGCGQVPVLVLVLKYNFIST